MANLTTHQIRERAKEIVLSRPGGIRTADLVNIIVAENRETNRGTIQTQTSKIAESYPDLIRKPSRGLFVSASSQGSVQDQPEPGTIPEKKTEIAPSGASVQESDFYEPFARMLKNDLDEVTNVVTLGGAMLRSKWGTPDVVGVYKPVASDLIKFPVEIVSAEIKIDPQQPVVAFGQAIAYRLFSAKTYIAMPSTLTEEDQDRLESLCVLFGVGLVLFELNPENPNFEIRVRAQRFSPDMFYVNNFADRLRDAERAKFDALLG